jgi:hypothetical protein
MLIQNTAGLVMIEHTGELGERHKDKVELVTLLDSGASIRLINYRRPTPA